MCCKCWHPKNVYIVLWFEFFSPQTMKHRFFFFIFILIFLKFQTLYFFKSSIGLSLLDASFKCLNSWSGCYLNWNFGSYLMTWVHKKCLHIQYFIKFCMCPWLHITSPKHTPWVAAHFSEPWPKLLQIIF